MVRLCLSMDKLKHVLGNYIHVFLQKSSSRVYTVVCEISWMKPANCILGFTISNNPFCSSFLFFFSFFSSCERGLGYSLLRKKKFNSVLSSFISAFADFRHLYCHLSWQMWLFFEHIRLILSNAVDILSNGVISTIGARIYAVLVKSLSSRFLRLHIIPVFNAYLEAEMRNCCEYCHRWLRACPKRVWWLKQIYN